VLHYSARDRNPKVMMMAYAVYDFSETLERLTAEEHGFARADVVACLCAYGENGDMAEWNGGFVVALRDGRVACVTGWCDTTGWGCQDGVEAHLMPAEPDGNWLWPDGQRHDTDILPRDLNRFLAGDIDELFEP
jgi:hypothetical protein